MEHLIRPTIKTFVIALLIMPLAAGSVQAQQQSDAGGPGRLAVMAGYEPGQAFPFGKLNPQAPPETAEFSFMIGEHDCIDQIRDRKTGKWQKFPAVWNAKYFLNGNAIQDHYWSPRFSTSNIRIFDRKDKKWKVTFFQMPNYNASEPWEGVRENNKMVMRKGNDSDGSRLTFFKISKSGFEWVGESMKDGQQLRFGNPPANVGGE